MKNYYSTVLLAVATAAITTSFCFAEERDFTVRTDNGVPRMVSSGKPIVQRLFSGNPIHLPTVSMAYDYGVSIFQIADYYMVWEGQPESAFEKFDSYLDTVLALNPDIRVIPRIKMDDRVPPFLEKHPECYLRQEDGSPVYGYGKHQPIASIAHPLYIEEYTKALRRTIRHLEKKYGDRIAGYHPGYGNGSEWQYWHFSREGHFSGYDVGTRDAFRRWLRNKYKTDAALQKAWHNSDITFDTVVVPSVKERRGIKGSMMFHDPQIQQNVIDFNFFHNENMADALLAAARVIREEVGRKKLSCTFYGYTFECATSWHNGSPVSGHNALWKVLESGLVDVIAGPFSYQLPNRSISGGAAAHSPTESISAAGILWLNEDDNATHIANPDVARGKFLPDGACHRFRTVEESRKILLRNQVFNYMRNYANWWQDLFGRKWYFDKRYWDAIASLGPLEKEMMENPRPFKPEIALIIDENSMNYIVSGREAFRLMAFSAHEVRDRVSRSSSVYGQYLLRDVLKGKVDTKVDIHCASVALSAEERAILKKRAEKNPTIWLIAPGYIDKDQQKQSLEAMTELTGFKFIRPVTRELRARSSGDGMSWGLPYEFGGFSLGAQPFAVVPEKDDILLARFTDNTAAVVYRPGKDGRAPAIFCGTSDLPPLLIRRMAQEAGARVWCEEDLHVQHNGNFASFTAPAAGMYRIDTGHNGKILDIISGETFDGPSVIRHFTPGETLVVKFE